MLIEMVQVLTCWYHG